METIEQKQEKEKAEKAERISLLKKKETDRKKAERYCFPKYLYFKETPYSIDIRERELLTKGYLKAIKTIHDNMDKEDVLHDIIVSQLADIKSDNWIYNSNKNAYMYLKAGLNNGMVNVKLRTNRYDLSSQGINEDYVLSYVDTNDIEQKNKIDLFDYILGQKCFTKKEKKLIKEYYIKGKTYKEIASDKKVSFKTIGNYVDKINHKLATLDVRDVYNTNFILNTIGDNRSKETIDITTKISLLKRYRRNIG